MKPFVQIEAEKGKFTIAMMCRLLKVSRSGYYAQQVRGPSRRQQEDETLSGMIRHYHQESRGCYGSPRIYKDLKELGFEVGRHRIARLMRNQGITGDLPKRFKRTTDSNHCFPVANNVLDRKFKADAPNKTWVADITYVRTWEGWLYLATIIDLFSRKVVGWSMATHLGKELALEALNMALGLRTPAEGMLFHSDRGCQYASRDYRQILSQRKIICSMSRKGNCWDNAVAESFFGKLKTELIYRNTMSTIALAKTAIVDYIEVFYNRKRRHSTLGYISPVEFEKRFAKKMAEAA